MIPAEALIEEEVAGAAAAAGLNGTGMDIDGPCSGGVVWRGELVDEASSSSSSLPPAAAAASAGTEDQRSLHAAAVAWPVVEYCPAKTLEEWAEYITKAPMLVSKFHLRKKKNEKRG